MILFQKLTKKDKARVADEPHGLMSQMCRNGLLDGLVEDYINMCHSTHLEASEESSRGKVKVRLRFANLAGLCRYMGTGLSDLAALRGDFPDEYDKLLAIFEDEALNAEVSPTLLSAYLKKRIRYGDLPEEKSDSKEVRYCFEHDVFADGE